MHSGLSDNLVIVEVAHGIGQDINPVNSVICRGLRLRGLLPGRLCLLVGSGSAGVHVLNTGLRAGVNVLDRLRVLGGQVVELVGLVDNWRGLLTNIIFAGAADRRHHACCQCND